MNKKILSYILCLFFVASCGGSDSLGQSKILAAPLLYEGSNELLVKIPENNLQCGQYKVREILDGNIFDYDLRYGKNELLIDSIKEKTVYNYECIVNNIVIGISRSSSVRYFEIFDLKYWGALSIDDFNKDGLYEVLGIFSEAFGFERISEDKLGLGGLARSGRAYRDIRFADLDNDGNLDALANVYSENNNDNEFYDSYLQVYWGKNDGKFILDSNFEKRNYHGYGETIVFSDFDNDGFLDILVPQYNIKNSKNIYSRNLLFKNLNNRQFEEVANYAGISIGLQTQPEGAQAFDFNADGYIDIYVGGSLYINNKNFTFTDVTESVGLPGVFDEGIKFFDFDLDGDFDFILNTAYSAPKIYINNGGHFKITEVNLFPTDFYKSIFGLQLSDFNNDGFEDILLAGGVDQNNKNIEPRFYLHLNGNYIKQPIIKNDTNWSDLVGFGDFNNDGSFDMVLRYGTFRLIFNKNIPTSFVKLDVFGSGFKNQHGRSVRVNYADGRRKIMAIDGGSGFMSNLPYTLNIPNDKSENLLIEVFCSDSVKLIKAIHGYHKINC